MTATPKYSRGNQVTRKVTNGVTVRESRLVAGVAGGTVQEAAANSDRIAGVAQNDQTSPDPEQVLSSEPSVLGEVTVRRGEVLPVVFSAAVDFMQPIICTGAGEVGPVGAQTDPVIVGHAEETVVAPGVGLAYIKDSVA